MIKRRILVGLALLQASVLGCADGTGLLVAPEAPALLAGPTATVTVSCPANMVDGQSGQCSAAGYDANGVFTKSTPVTWGTTTSSLVSVSAAGVAKAAHLAQGTAVVQATIDGVTGSTNISISQSDLSVSISIQASTIKPNATCYWWATVSGGTAPYSYSWTRSGGTSTSSTSEFTTQSSSNFTIFLTVTDALGTKRSTTKSVTVSSSAMVCPF